VRREVSDPKRRRNPRGGNLYSHDHGHFELARERDTSDPIAFNVGLSPVETLLRRLVFDMQLDAGETLLLPSLD
jgi:hypothetical protein